MRRRRRYGRGSTTRRPYKSLNLAPTDYYDRESTHGVTRQALCDAWRRFVFMDSSFAGATNDVVARRQTLTRLCSAYMDEKLRLALDEAYSSIKDGFKRFPSFIEEYASSRAKQNFLSM